MKGWYVLLICFAVGFFFFKFLSLFIDQFGYLFFFSLQANGCNKMNCGHKAPTKLLLIRVPHFASASYLASGYYFAL